MGELDPAAYRAWLETPLGSAVDSDEKRLLFGLARLRRGERVLDVGCGEGSYTEGAARATGAAVGLDRSARMLRAAAARLRGLAGIEWVEGDAESLPFPDESFDVVLAVTVLSFTRRPEALLREAHRVLRPGGRIVVGELGRWSAWAAIRAVRRLLGSETWRGTRFFSRRELREQLVRVGFGELHGGGAVYYPPVSRPWLLGALRVLERVGPRVAPALGTFLVLSGTRPRFDDR